jgi:hypothetical protein
MAGFRLEIFNLRRFDFDGLAAGTSMEVVVREALNVSEFTEATLLVRTHTGTSIAGSSLVYVNANIYAPSPDDPANDVSFSKFSTRVQLDSSASVPGLTTAAIVQNYGGLLRISVAGNRDAGGAAVDAVLSAEMSVKMSTPAFRQYVKRLLRIADRVPIEAGLALAAQELGYRPQAVPLHARELRRYLALRTATHCGTPVGLDPLWTRFLKGKQGFQRLSLDTGDRVAIQAHYVEAFGEEPPAAFWGGVTGGSGASSGGCAGCAGCPENLAEKTHALQ